MPKDYEAAIAETEDSEERDLIEGLWADDWRKTAEQEEMDWERKERRQFRKRREAFDTSNPDAYLRRGAAHVKNKDYNRAIVDFTCAIHLNPKDPEPHRRRGGAYVLSGAYNRAVRSFTRAIQLDPKDPRTYQLRAVAHRLTGANHNANADDAKAKHLKKAKNPKPRTDF